MHAGQITDMKPGAIGACVIPMGLGGLALISMVVFWLQVPAGGGRLMTGPGLLLSSVVACFVFGSPMAAWLACRSLAKIACPRKLSRWRSSAVRGLLFASLMHVFWAGLYTFGYALVILNGPQGVFPDSSPQIGTSLGFIMGSTLLNMLAWILVTLPLSLLCATIFWYVTKFPDDLDVF